MMFPMQYNDKAHAPTKDVRWSALLGGMALLPMVGRTREITSAPRANYFEYRALRVFRA